MARSLLVVVLTVALSTGCGQSLFDADPGDDDTDGAGDRDASVTDDGSDDDGQLDAGLPEIDAAPAVDCPEPCAGDAVADFALLQGEAWSYRVDTGSPDGLVYEDLTLGDVGPLFGWRSGDGGASIVSCSDDNAGQPGCEGLDGFLLVSPGEPGGARSVLVFRAPETAGYRLSGAVRVADGQSLDVPVQLIVGRPGRHDAMQLRSLRTSEEEVALDALFSASEGDEILLTVGSEDVDAPPIGLRVFFTRIDEGPDAFPGTCQIAMTFDGVDALDETCGTVQIQDLNDGIGPKGTSTEGTGPTGLGLARTFTTGQYLALGTAPLDYSGDFTIQLWAQVNDPIEYVATLYADWNTEVRGGMALSVDYDSPDLYFCHMENGSPDDSTDCVTDTEPDDTEWHFWRIVRSTADESLTLCLDGAVVVRLPVPDNADLTSDEAPRVARNVVYEPAYFAGSVDDIRVYAEALPCAVD